MMTIILVLLRPKHMSNKMKWKLGTELSNLLIFAEVQSLAAQNYQDFH